MYFYELSEGVTEKPIIVSGSNDYQLTVVTLVVLIHTNDKIYTQKITVNPNPKSQDPKLPNTNP